MRTIVQFDPDTSTAIARFRRETQMGLSDAVNHLVRHGILSRPRDARFKQETYALGLKVDVST